MHELVLDILEVDVVVFVDDLFERELVGDVFVVRVLFDECLELLVGVEFQVPLVTGEVFDEEFVDVGGEGGADEDYFWDLAFGVFLEELPGFDGFDEVL